MDTKKKTILFLTVVPVFMFGFGFAMVPLYKLVCAVTGINSAGNVEETDGRELASMSQELREVTLEFDSTINGGAPLEFYPMDKTLVLNPGGKTHTSFYVKNLSDKDMTTQSIPGITPWQATKYIKKMECFCFNKQILKAGEEKEMGVTFYIDPELPEEYKTITLSYTIMDINRKKMVEAAQKSLTRSNVVEEQ